MTKLIVNRTCYVSMLFFLLIVLVGTNLGTASAAPTITASAAHPLTFENLDGSIVTLTLSGGTFHPPINGIIRGQIVSNSVLGVEVSGIPGVRIPSERVPAYVFINGVQQIGRRYLIDRISPTELEVELAFDGTDFDTDAVLTFTVQADAIENYDGVALTADIRLATEPKNVSASVVSPLTEATLDGSVVTLTLTGAVYEQDISKIRDAVSVSGIDGVTVDTTTAQRVSDRRRQIELDFDGTDFFRDTALTFTLTLKAIADHTGELTTEISVSADRNADILTMFWVDYGTDKIQRANLDGSNIEDLVIQGLRDPHGIALDVEGGKMYWADSATHKIQRANLDGSNVEDLVTQGLRSPSGIALDVAGGKMYWTDSNTDKIQRANLDGSNVEDLVTQGLSGPYGIALDVASGKMYWTDWYTKKIQRANFDGSNVEDLVTQGLEIPISIALDFEGGKMYWTDYGTDKIQRANLDGSNVEDLITRGLQAPRHIALDIAGGKMYWTDSDTEKIQRANFDGSNVEDLITQGLKGPSGIALGVISPVNPTIVN